MELNQNVIETLKQTGDEVNSSMINDLLYQWYNTKGKTAYNLYQRYIGDDPIFKRQLKNPDKVNNRILSDFHSDIIDTKAGYMYGTPVKVVAGDDEATETLSLWGRYNDIDDATADAGKLAACCGYAAYFLFNAPDGLRCVAVRKPWELVPIIDESTGDTYAALWSYVLERIMPDGTIYQINVCEWYTEKTVETWHSIGGGSSNATGIFIAPHGLTIGGSWKKVDEQPHGLSGCPIIFLPNNSEWIGDTEKSLSLIDGYNRAVSDASSELEQLRLAYMFLKGAGLNLSQDVLDSFKQTGVFPLSETGEVGFITKTIDLTAVKILLDEIRRNIYSFARSIDWSQESTSDMRIIGWQIKLMPLETKCKVTERKATKALRELYRLITDWIGIYSMPVAGIQSMRIDANQIRFVFTRNIPKDIEAESRILAQLKGLVSDETALGLMSFIESPQEELEKLGPNINLDAIGNEDTEEESTE